MSDTKETLWESQRCYGFAGWHAPLVFERPRWSDAEGKGVQIRQDAQPSQDGNTGWVVVVSSATDEDGWQYSTSFDKIDKPRAGGRASKRATDSVRKRQWIVQPKGSSSSSSRKNVKPWHTYRGLRAFVALFGELLKRRQIWEVLPWDPGAWVVVHAEHQEYLSAALSLQSKLKGCALNTGVETTKLLETMLCGAVHANAAYGYCAMAGHLQSVEKMVMMRTVHNTYFDPVSGASAEANNQAVAALVGVREEDILHAEWENTEFRPCHYVAIDRAQKVLVLAIRGSMQMGDIMTDVSAQPVTMHFGNVTGQVHEGMLAAATYVQCRSAAALETAAKTCPGWPLLITGHSLGGGVAALLTLLLHNGPVPDGFSNIYCVGFGPAAVVSEDLADYCKDFVTSVVYACDVVPRLSCASVEALLVELVNASPAKRAVEEFLVSATNALQKLTDRLFEEPKRLKAGNLVKKYSGLKSLEDMVQDSGAVGRAVRAVQLAERPSDKMASGSSDLDPPGADADTASVQKGANVGATSAVLDTDPEAAEGVGIHAFNMGQIAQTLSVEASSGCVGSAAHTGVEVGPTSPKVTPLYPPGTVMWILDRGAVEKGEAAGPDKVDEPWWKNLSSWSMDLLPSLKKRSSSPASEHSILDGSRLDAGMAGASLPGEGPQGGTQGLTCHALSDDLQWLENWIEECEHSDGHRKGHGLEHADLSSSTDTFQGDVVADHTASCVYPPRPAYSIPGGSGTQIEGSDLGGDHSVDAPCAVAASEQDPCMQGTGRAQVADGAQKTEAGKCPVLMEVDRKSFGRILLHPDMMQHHLPDEYMQGIQRLLSDAQCLHKAQAKVM